MNNLLITFGCSWTYGVSAIYQPGMSRDYLFDNRHDIDSAERYSFRSLLSQKYAMKNVNLSVGGSSNQTQFRLAENFFASAEFEKYKKNFDHILVLWGVTSVYRNEAYFPEMGKYHSFKYDQSEIDLSKVIYTQHFDADIEIDALGNKIHFWDKFFQLQGIKNLWFDTFNHHDYPGVSPQMFCADEKPRDLLSKMAIQQGFLYKDRTYHKSCWQIDSDRVAFLTDKEMLNPHSSHPTQSGHELIADFLSPWFEQNL